MPKLEILAIQISRRLRLAVLAGAMIMLIKSLAFAMGAPAPSPMTGRAVDISTSPGSVAPPRPDKCCSNSVHDAPDMLEFLQVFMPTARRP